MSVPAAIPPFFNHLPVRSRFGDGVASELGDVLHSYGADRALMMIDVGLDEANAPIAHCIAAVGAAGAQIERVLKSPGEPTTDVVDRAAAALSDARPRAVIGRTACAGGRRTSRRGERGGNSP